MKRIHTINFIDAMRRNKTIVTDDETIRHEVLTMIARSSYTITSMVENSVEDETFTSSIAVLNGANKGKEAIVVNREHSWELSIPSENVLMTFTGGDFAEFLVNTFTRLGYNTVLIDSPKEGD